MAKKDLSFILNHLGEDRENYFNAIAPPVIQTSNFCFKTVADMRSALGQEFEVPFYTRGNNPTVTILRKKIAALEGAEDALIFASGCAAISAAVMSIVKSGDHAICVKNAYGWTNSLLTQYLNPYGVTSTIVDGENTASFEKAIRPTTKLIYLESPNSFTLEVQDIEAIARLARKHGITTIIDNSYSTPINQSPLELGIDMVVHSASKYLGGHSDIIAGVICSSRERVNKLFSEEFMTLGGIISPQDAWLMLRGLRTLDLRVKRSSESAAKIVEFLEKHPKIEEVIYPFSSTYKHRDIARKQMKDGGGLLSVKIRAKEAPQLESFCNSLSRFLMACSWGGYESLIFPVVALPSTNKTDKNSLPWNLVRLYIGLEDADVLIEDLRVALEKV